LRPRGCLGIRMTGEDGAAIRGKSRRAISSGGGGRSRCAGGSFGPQFADGTAPLGPAFDGAGLLLSRRAAASHEHRHQRDADAEMVGEFDLLGSVEIFSEVHGARIVAY